MTRKLEREVSELCNLSKNVEEKGIRKGLKEGRKEGLKEGLKEGILTSIQNLMESMNWTAEQAMEALKVPETEWSQYASRLKV